ncbi:MAG: protease inhibitor I42 family protein [Treponema sp.]|nr:protease inhibitor I42 family protein [Treponema sp.]
MRKIFTFLVLSVCMMVTGCNSNKKFESQTRTIQLRGNPTTGYTWCFSVLNEDIISVTEDVEYLGDVGIVGAPSMFNYTLYSEAPGSTEVRFEYKRAWEDKTPEDVRRYEVTVKESGQIVLKEK